ncbi:MAG: HAMP domain-containing protein [Nitrospirae bacterium]|nr:HAMP domain-containing protein [Nitrospirota bacterium]
MKAFFKWLLNSIAVRISVSTAFVVAATTVAVATLIIREERNVLESELQKKGTYLAEIIAQQMLEPILYEERYAMHSLLRSSMVSENDIVVFGIVYDAKGEPIVKLTSKWFKAMPADRKYPMSADSVSVMEDAALQVYDITVPVIAKGLGSVGYLRLGITKKFLIKTIEDVKNKLYILSSVIIFSGIMTGLWMARKIIRPVLMLNQGVKRIGGGELGAEVGIVGDGEIKELSIAFNEMSRRLKESVDAIKTAQDNLIRTEKLYALGEFSAGLAHEIKNPLTSIKMLMQTVKEKAQTLSSRDIEIIEGEINRIDKIVKDFLAFGRPARAEFITTNINELIREMVTLSKPKMERSNIRLIEELDDSIPIIMAYPDGIRQVFLNVILNAIQAMEGGGTLKVSSSSDNGTVAACIQDTGAGIPDEVSSRIFDPFFTTKEEGTGMGLAIAYNIVREHNGEIVVSSTANRGTIVSVVLPETIEQDGLRE